jgi:hypothetical protein
MIVSAPGHRATTILHIFVERSLTIERYCLPPPHTKKNGSDRASTIYIFSIFVIACAQLQLYNYNFKITIFKCNFKRANLQVQFTSFAQPKGKCLLLFKYILLAACFPFALSYKRATVRQSKGDSAKPKKIYNI